MEPTEVTSEPPSAGERATAALDARLPVTESARALLRKAFPDHWSFLLGEVALYSFVVLLLTGGAPPATLAAGPPPARRATRHARRRPPHG